MFIIMTNSLKNSHVTQEIEHSILDVTYRQFRIFANLGCLSSCWGFLSGLGKCGEGEHTSEVFSVLVQNAQKY